MTATTTPVTAEAAVAHPPVADPLAAGRPAPVPDLTSLVWLFPILWTLLQALRPYGDMIKDGYVAWPAHLSSRTSRRRGSRATSASSSGTR